jgi:hypothetical protein
MNTLKKINYDLCEKVKSHMEGRKQRWLANQLGLTDTALSNRINAIYSFRNEEIKKMAEVFSDKTFLDYVVL